MQSPRLVLEDVHATAQQLSVQHPCGQSRDPVVGPALQQQPNPHAALSPIPAATEVAIYNLGTTGADAYAGANTATLAAIGANSITLAAARQFPYASPGKRFYLIGTPVSYACSAGGSLTRISGYSKQASQPTSAPAGSSTAVLAGDVGSCSVDYQQGAIDQFGLLYLSLQITRSNESVSLTHAIQINNIP